VNEFMDYVKRELARGIDDWEQRLSTAMVKSGRRICTPRTAQPPDRGRGGERRGRSRRDAK
jgi:hypothetical protein